jgi:hypothetical protein
MEWKKTDENGRLGSQRILSSWISQIWKRSHDWRGQRDYGVRTGRQMEKTPTWDGNRKTANYWVTVRICRSPK